MILITPPDDDGTVLGVTYYPDGSLLRSPDKRIYIIIDGMKKRILNLAELWQYRGQEIINVSFEEIAQYPDYAKKTIPKVAPGYGDGALIRNGDKKVYAIKCAKKYHVKTWLELYQRFAGQEIFNVPQEVIDSYADYIGDYDQQVCTPAYPNGTLIREGDHRIYVIKDGRKYWIRTLDELAAKYIGHEIINVGQETIDWYLDY